MGPGLMSRRSAAILRQLVVGRENSQAFNATPLNPEVLLLQRVAKCVCRSVCRVLDAVGISTLAQATRA
jgi:hypothetical protein